MCSSDGVATATTIVQAAWLPSSVQCGSVSFGTALWPRGRRTPPPRGRRRRRTRRPPRRHGGVDRRPGRQVRVGTDRDAVGHGDHRPALGRHRQGGGVLVAVVPPAPVGGVSQRRPVDDCHRLERPVPTRRAVPVVADLAATLVADRGRGRRELEARVERQVLPRHVSGRRARGRAVRRPPPRLAEPRPLDQRLAARRAGRGNGRGSGLIASSQQAPRANPRRGVEQLVTAGHVGGGVGELEESTLGGRPQRRPRSGDPADRRADALAAGQGGQRRGGSAAASSASSDVRGSAAVVRTRSPAIRAVSSS